MFNTDAVEKNWNIVPEGRYIPVFYPESSYEYNALSYLSSRKALVLPEFWAQFSVGENDLGNAERTMESIKFRLYVLRYPDENREINIVYVKGFIEKVDIPKECYLMVMELNDNEHVRAMKKHYKIGKRKCKDGKHFAIIALKWRGAISGGDSVQ